MKISFPSPAPTLGDDIEEALRGVAQELGYSREQLLRGYRQRMVGAKRLPTGLGSKRRR